MGFTHWKFRDESSIHISPNPGNNHIQIQSPWQSAQLLLNNMQGIEVMRKQIDHNERISVAHLPGGVYLYHLIGPNSLMASGKWVKE